MRPQTAKQISQLRRRRRMLGRKLLPKVKGALQAGRIGKPIHNSHQWTVTPISQVDQSLVKSVSRVTSAVPTCAARRRGAAANKVSSGMQNIWRGLEESFLGSSELDQEGQRGESSQRRRRRKKRNAAAPVAAQNQFASEESEEEESPNEHSISSAGDVDEEDCCDDSVTTLENSSSDSETVSDEDSGSASDKSECDGVPDMLMDPKPKREDREDASPVGSDDEQEMDEEELEAMPTAGNLYRVFMASERVLVVVQPPAVVRLSGRAKLRVLHGMVDVEGLLLMCAESVRHGRPTTTMVQSGYPSGLVYVRPFPFVPPLRTGKPLCRALAKLGLNDSWAQLRPFLAKRSAVILLEKVPGGEWTVDAKSSASVWGPFRALGFRISMDETSSVAPSHPWRAEAATLAKNLLCTFDSPEGRTAPPRILVCGRQNSGKSSLLRVFVNSFLNLCKEVLYLDCDPGQCEFTPSATISLTRVTGPLMGPPFTHVQTPMKAYFLGHVSPASQPDAYSEAVRALIEHAHKVAPRTPLFVNTMGWISGLGLSLLVDVIRLSRPTDVVQLLTGEGTTDLPPLDNDLIHSACGWTTSRDGTNRPLTGVTYHPLPGSTCRGRSWARIKREAMVLAYLGQHVGSGLERPIPEAYHWLWNTVPMRVPWSAVVVHDCDNAVPKKELLHALRGSVVALCVVSNDKLLETEDPTYPKFIDGCGPYECLGYGLVRAIDPSERLFYITSPEPHERLSRVNALIRGDLHLPESLLTTQAQMLQCSWAPYVAGASRDLDRSNTNEAEYTANDTS